jgi:polyisoprenoid-binding protein YceI
MLDFQTTKGLPSTNMTSASQAQISGGVWTIDPNHSLIEFSARHFDIAYVKGRFKSFSGKIEVNEQDLLQSKVDLTIDASSLDSQAVQMREDLIKGEEMLEVAKYPSITFKSTRIASRDASHYDVTGDLTMRGITKSITIPIEFGGLVTTRMGPRAGFAGSLVLNKSDFQVPFNREFEPGRFVVADEIKVELQIEVAPAAS